jgi:rfaE bifunctional protein kinase chain/domain
VKNLLAKFSQQRILVVGDVMLDETILGSFGGRASDPRMAVIRRQEHSQAPGGAANAAANAASLGASVVLAGVIGADEPGKRLCRELTARSIDSAGLFIDSTRPTTSKMSVLTTDCRYRLDHESRAALPEAVEESLWRFLEQRLPGVDACLVSDYAKGVVSPSLVARLTRLCSARGIPVVVDPKGNNLDKYHGATLLKPNLADAASLLQRQIESEEDVLEAGRLLVERLGCSVLLTRGPHGVSLFQAGAEPMHLPALARLVSDETGAGDTVAATLAVALAAGASPPDAALLANRAAAVVVGLPGTVAVRREELLAPADEWPAVEWSTNLPLPRRLHSATARAQKVPLGAEPPTCRSPDDCTAQRRRRT